MEQHQETSNDHYTPKWVFDLLNVEFDIDVASPPGGVPWIPAKRYFTQFDDGLTQNWEGFIWCNPPYGRVINAWIQKAYEHSINGGGRVVMLLPARTDTKWFHDYAIKGKVEFLRGRLKFGGSLSSAPFPSILVTFDE